MENQQVKFYQVEEFPPEPAVANAWYVLKVGSSYQLRVTNSDGQYKKVDSGEVVCDSLTQMYAIPPHFRQIGMVALIRSWQHRGKRFRLKNNPSTEGTSASDWEPYQSVEEVNLGHTNEIINFMNTNLNQISN